MSREPDDENGALTQAADLAALIFRTTEWTWKDKGSVSYVPDGNDVRACFAKLLAGVREGKQFSSGAGRLLIERDELHGYSLLIRLADISTDEDGLA